MVCRHRGAVNGLHVGHMSVTFLTDHEQVIDARNHTVHCIVARERHTQKEGPIQPCQIRTGFRAHPHPTSYPSCLSYNNTALCIELIPTQPSQQSLDGHYKLHMPCTL